MYKPTEWKDHMVRHLHRYRMSPGEEEGTVYLTPSPGEIEQQGTPQNAENFNHMETGIYENSEAVDQHFSAENPHNITKETVGLGNVPNVATNDQAPTFTQADSREDIASGEKLSTIFGKIKKWLADLKAVAFTGSYNDLADKPAIPAETRVKGNEESAYRTGNVNLTPADIGAPSMEYMDGHFVADYASSAHGIVSPQGWYRIAQSPVGCYFSCTISLKRGYSYNAPEYQMFQLLDTHTKKKFVSLIAQSSSHIWKKIRLTRNTAESMNYIEIYQDTTTGLANDWRISVWDAIGIGYGNWKAIAPVATEEEVDGVTVLASLDLPAEFDPSHNIMDTDNNSNISFSYHKPGLNSAEWLAAWNGYELRAIAPGKITGVGSAVKATQDSAGNVIKDTYWDKSKSLILAEQIKIASYALGANDFESTYYSLNIKPGYTPVAAFPGMITSIQVCWNSCKLEERVIYVAVKNTANYQISTDVYATVLYLRVG